MLIEYLNGDYNPNNYDREGLHASTMGNCPRAIYYSKVLGKKIKLDPRVKRIFATGDSFHSQMIRFLYAVPNIRVAAAEINMPENGLIKGTTDAIIGIQSENFIVDFKSMNSFGFKKLFEPKEEHLIQILIYLYYFKIRRGILIIEDKNTCELKEFIVDSFKAENQAIISETLDKAKYLLDCIKNKIVPPKPIFTKDDKWKCKYCQYCKECKEEVWDTS